jgi:hypothetical protein
MSIRRWLFETPQFKDEDKNRSAQLLHIILLAYLASTLTFLVILPLMTPDLIERALFVIAFIPLFMMLFWMMRRGYIRLAAFILLAFNWTILVMMSLGASGVHDHGIGIPPQSLDRIFSPFHRADNAYDFDGTGLGLAIVKEHVDAMGGTITCESVVNEGTTFRVVLPQS